MVLVFHLVCNHSSWKFNFENKEKEASSNYHIEAFFTSPCLEISNQTKTDILIFKFVHTF